MKAEDMDMQDKIRRAKLQLGDDFGDEKMMEEAIFKVGMQVGRQEVVDWLFTHRVSDIPDEQLKAWGITPKGTDADQ